jgi:PAS domain S-box-containing protein
LDLQTREVFGVIKQFNPAQAALGPEAGCSPVRGQKREERLPEIDFRLLLEAFSDAAIVADGTHRIIYANPAAERLLQWRATELVGEPLTTFIPERLQRAHREGFKRYCATHKPMLIGKPVRVPALRRDGEEIEVELHLTALQLENDDVIVGLLRESGDREELERQLAITRYLRATTSAAAKLGSRLRPEQVLETAVETLVKDFDAALARIWLYEPSSNALLLRASAGLSAATTNSTRARIDVTGSPSKIAEVARTKRPFISNSLAGDAQFDQAWLQRERIVAVAAFPLASGDGLHGVLVFFARTPLREEVSEALSAFVAIVTATLNDVGLFAREQAARIEAEVERQKLQTILDMLPMGVLLSEGPEGPLHVVNPAGREIWGEALEGRAVDELPSLFPFQTMEGEPLGTEQVPLWRALHQRQRARETVRYHRPDGQEGVLEVIAAPFPVPSGGAVATYRDITARLRMESELAERASQFKALLDHLPVGVAYFDQKCVCRASNGPALRILCRSGSDIRGASADELFVGVPELHSALRRCITEQQPHAEQAMPWPDPAGGEAARYLDWRFEPLPAVPPRFPGALALIIDVTDRTRAEEALKEAKNAAEQAASNKSRFLSAVSHDLRTPVNALSLLAELLIQEVAARDDPNGELEELADDIHQAATNLIELINDLLDLARFDSGDVEHHPTNFPLDQWLTSTVEPLLLTAQTKNLALEWHVDQPGRILHADRVKLMRVLTNLVGNAIKFTDQGRVSVHAGATPEGWLALSVTDTGPGIPQDQRERIFDEFAQLRNPERDRTKGSGLGLAICKRLVEAVGGRLALQSRLGAGSTFTALFPPSHLQPSQLPTAPGAGAPFPTVALPGPLLVVEDDPRSREALSRLLEFAGFEVESACDGVAAFEILDRVRPSLILLDLMLPGMDGIEIVRKLRQEPKWADLPVVLLTGDVQGAHPDDLKALNVAETLAKPVDFDALRAVITRHVHTGSP